MPLDNTRPLRTPIRRKMKTAMFDEGLKAPAKRGVRAKRLVIPEMTAAEEKAAASGVVLNKEIVRISEPRLKTTTITIRGIAPYVQHAFSEKSRAAMEATQRAGQQARGRKIREPKNFEAIYEAAKHVSKQGWCGIPAPAFRNAMIDACRLVGFKMTHAKLSIFVEADGWDRVEGSPLVKIKGEPRIHRMPARNDNGSTDIRWRPMWEEWKADVQVTWDLDQFSATDVVNLMQRAGKQVGIGEGRPNSPKSNGLGWGRFEVVP